MMMTQPPCVDFAASHDEIWKTRTKMKEKTLRHIGVIVAKTGHDRGQKEMFLYSPTVKRDDGRIVCSSDFLNFEVGEWILFNVQVQSNKEEVYVGGKKWTDPIATGIRFDCPTVKVRACMYPDGAYSSIYSRQQTHRCWSPDIGDCFIDAAMFKFGGANDMVSKFASDRNRLYYVTATYHFTASVFNDLGAKEYEGRVYWRIDSVEGVVEKAEDVPDWGLAPWRNNVRKYLEKRQNEGILTNAVPPWYIRSSRLLTYDMIFTWAEEAATYERMGQDYTKDHPVPFLMNENGTLNQTGFKEIFNMMMEKLRILEEETQLHNHNPEAHRSIYSWKKVMSYDGAMLEPGSQLPRVSESKKERAAAERVELVQDSAGLFMNSAAARSYVEIKESGTDKLWMTGGWKRPGQAWESEAVGRNKTVHKADEAPPGKASPVESLHVVAKTGPQKKNLLGARKPPAKKPEVPAETQSAAQRNATPLSPPLPLDQPVAQASAVQPKPAGFSFASAAKISKSSEDAAKELSPIPVPPHPTRPLESVTQVSGVQSNPIKSSFASAANISKSNEDAAKELSPTTTPPSLPHLAPPHRPLDKPVAGVSGAQSNPAFSSSLASAVKITKSGEGRSATPLPPSTVVRAPVVIGRPLFGGFAARTLKSNEKAAEDLKPTPHATRPLEPAVGVSTIGQKPAFFNSLANAAKISNNNVASVEDSLPTAVPPPATRPLESVAQSSSAHLKPAYFSWTNEPKPSKRPDLDSDDLDSDEEERLSSIHIPPLDHSAAQSSAVQPNTNKISFATKKSKGYVDSDDLTESEEEEAHDVDGAIIDPGKLDEAGRKLYEQYQKRKEHVEKYEAEARKPPCLKGLTARQYIKSQQATINYTRNRISMGLNEETEDARRLIRQCTANIACVENKLAMGDLMESELVEIHRSENDDASVKNLLRHHVENQKAILREEKERLLGMQKMQISESRC